MPLNQNKLTDSHLICQIPQSYPLPLLFHLLHYGKWCPEKSNLTITAQTLLDAKNIGYPSTFLVKILQETSNQLTTKIKERIYLWEHQQNEVELIPAFVLQTRGKERMQELRQIKPINRHIQTQLSPTQAIVSQKIERPLSKSLSQEGIPFQHTTKKHIEMKICNLFMKQLG